MGRSVALGQARCNPARKSRQNCCFLRLTALGQGEYVARPFFATMLDFQKIRNKQKWLFALIAIPVIFGFVILFTPDAEDRLFGRNNISTEEGTLGSVDDKPVSRNEWMVARE